MKVEMKSQGFKQLFAFTMLAATIGWAVFAVLITKATMAQPTATGVLEVAGMGVVIGALITWTSSVVQFFYRKKGPDEGTP